MNSGLKTIQASTMYDPYYKNKVADSVNDIGIHLLMHYVWNTTFGAEVFANFFY